MRAALKLGLGKLFGLFACVTILLAIASDARAILVAYEGFDYAANSPLLGLIGGTGWDFNLAIRISAWLPADGMASKPQLCGCDSGR